jgi:hypothetical protein
MKKVLISTGINLALLVIPFLLVEALFRLMPVAYLPPIEPVNAEAPMARFQPNVEYRWSRDWNFSVVTRKRSNNYGYIYGADYRPEEKTPLLALIGDSLLEAQQVDTGKSAGELLHAALAGQGRVYSLAISGAPLSQYLAYAEYARRTFRADALAIVIAPNDFDESLIKYKSDGRFHYFSEDGKLERVDYELTGIKSVLRHSAALRYIMYNLDAGIRLQAWKAAQSMPDVEKRLADSRKAVDYFFEQLPGRTGLGPERIVFVLDPLRRAIYSTETWEKARDTFYGRVPEYFAKQAAKRGYEVIDLAPVFIRAHTLGRTVESAPTDSHWSAFGHELVASQIAASRVFMSVFPVKPKLQTVSLK